jgi:hypothetical protein
MDDGKAMFDRIARQTKGLPRRYGEKGNGYALVRKEQLERLLKFVTEL